MQTRFVAIVTALALPFALGGFGASSFAHAQPAAVTPAAAQIDIHLGGNGQGQDPHQAAREQGHQDGMHAGFEDMHRGLSPDPHRHHEFRHPPVDRHLREAYRDGFRHGYDEAFHHANDRR